MLKNGRFFIFLGIFQLSVILGPIHFSWAEEISDVLGAGAREFAQGKFEEAEKFFSQAVEMESDNYTALRALADIKIKLKKYKAAETLLDRILQMPVAKGRNILVYIKGATEPREAELVDENVMAVDESGIDEELKGLGKFLRNNANEPVPHYRVYFKKTGKMKLLLKSKTRIKYHGIPTATREQVAFLKTDVQKKIISGLNTKPEKDMVEIEGGCFQMGSNAGDPDEQPVHQVCLSPFRMDKYEVRQKHFQAVTGLNPSQNVGADLPVDSVTWVDAHDYCKALGWRLPREAEWEYAARGGSTKEFYWGDTVTGKEANFCDSACELNIRETGLTDGFKKTAPVGSFPPNPFGLYDMAGNVGEWVRDWGDVETNYYLVGPRKDPLGARPDLDSCMRVDCVGAFSITQKIYRGGAWNQKASEMRSANRRDSHFQLRAEGTGFRCAADMASAK